jgi:hypothetical protein
MNPAGTGRTGSPARTFSNVFHCSWVMQEPFKKIAGAL